MEILLFIVATYILGALIAAIIIGQTTKIVEGHQAMDVDEERGMKILPFLSWITVIVIAILYIVFLVKYFVKRQ